MKETLKEDFEFNQVQESVSATVQQLLSKFSILSSKIGVKGRNGQKTLVVVCYRGGGGLDMR